MAQLKIQCLLVSQKNNWRNIHPSRHLKMWLEHRCSFEVTPYRELCWWNDEYFLKKRFGDQNASTVNMFTYVNMFTDVVLSSHHGVKNGYNMVQHNHFRGWWLCCKVSWLNCWGFQRQAVRYFPPRHESVCPRLHLSFINGSKIAMEFSFHDSGSTWAHFWSGSDTPNASKCHDGAPTAR